MTDRELFEMALKALEYPGLSWPEAREKAAEAIRARLKEPPKELELPKVRLWEFLKLIEGKEDFRGIPIMRTEWPMPEEK